MSVKVGIAGYMGAGKSCCAQLLSRRGFIIVDADKEAKRLMNSDAGVREMLAGSFGNEISGTRAIDFSVLGLRVFKSYENLLLLNSIVHPLLIEHLEKRIFECAGDVILDAALIPVWGVEKWFDYLFWIDAPFEIRLQRLSRKNNSLSNEDIVRRMRMQQQLIVQPSAPVWRVIDNRGSLAELDVAVSDSEIHGKGL